MARISESSIVAKCALVLDVLTEARRPLGFSDIAARTEFAKSSCHRILAVLQNENLVEYDKASRAYRAGRRLDRWARSAIRRKDLQDAASSVMADLCEQSRMNVALSILDRDTILYLRTVDFFTVRFASHAGDHAPVHCTAAGKVFLSHLSPAKFQTILGDLRFEKYTEFTKTSLEDLISEFPTIREAGYATARREETLQVTGIAAPIWNDQGQVVASLSLWSTADQVSPEEVIKAAPKLLESTADITMRLS